MTTTTTARPPKLTYFAGLSLGRPHEFTALAVVERSQPAGSSEPGRLGYAVRHLERFPPGTPYPDVSARAAALFAAKPLTGGTLVVDRTGVGRPVVEALRRAGERAAVRPVSVTAGLAARYDDRGGWLVPRADLVGTLQVLLQAGRLKVADALAEVGTLAAEMAAFKADPPSAGGDEVAAWRAGEADDLVLAVAVAAWEGERQGPGGTGRPGVYEPAGYVRW